jgi:hypothetical protein
VSKEAALVKSCGVATTKHKTFPFGIQTLSLEETPSGERRKCVDSLRGIVLGLLACQIDELGGGLGVWHDENLKNWAFKPQVANKEEMALPACTT